MSHSGNRHSRGGALLETAIAMPLLMLFAAGVVDLGIYLHAHFRASRIAYEGARYGASVQGLAAEPGYSGPVHDDIAARVQRLLGKYNIDSENFAFKLNYNSAEHEQIESTATVSYTPIAGFLRSSSAVSVKVTSPYLYPNS